MELREHGKHAERSGVTGGEGKEHGVELGGVGEEHRVLFRLDLSYAKIE